MSFGWLRELGKIGGLSGFESFVRNAAYMVMVVRMVNVVQAQGIYWVANSFIWSWMLLPVTQLGELIKQEAATGPETMRHRASGYFKITAVICGLWILFIPLWKPFMSTLLGYTDVDQLFQLVIILLGFYVVYAFQNVGDSMFYGLGKTQYLLFQSVVTNAVYYGGAFLLYQMGLWTPSLTGIALMFGCGMAFDAAASFGAYWYFCRKEIVAQSAPPHKRRAIRGDRIAWFSAPVLKTGEAQASVGSNPTLSATAAKMQRTISQMGAGFLHVRPSVQSGAKLVAPPGRQRGLPATMRVQPIWDLLL